MSYTNSIIALLWTLIFFVFSSPAAIAIEVSHRSIAPVIVSSRGDARSFSGQRVEVNLRMPQGTGAMGIEVVNHTNISIGLIEFNVSVLGASGNIRFSDLAPGSRGRNQIAIPSSRELSVRDILVFDKDATEQFPRVIVQIIWPNFQSANHLGVTSSRNARY